MMVENQKVYIVMAAADWTSVPTVAFTTKKQAEAWLKKNRPPRPEERVYELELVR